MILVILYIAFVKKMKVPNDYFRRVVLINNIFYMKKKSIKVLNELLKLDNLRKQDIYNAYAYLGEIYFQCKNYSKASEMFDIAYKMIRMEKIYYRDWYNIMIKSYFMAGRKDYAIIIYRELLEKKDYDKQFERVRKTSKLLGVK